jgi:hypothetical protein
MIDRYHTAALPFAGSSLLSRHYRQVPLLSIAWGIGEIALPLGKSGGIHVIGVRLPIPVDSTFIASLSWVGHIHLRIDEVAPTESAAADSTESLQMLLTLVHALEGSGGNQPFDPDTRAFLDSLAVERHGSQAIVTGTVPVGLVQRMLDQPEEIKALPGSAVPAHSPTAPAAKSPATRSPLHAAPAKKP